MTDLLRILRQTTADDIIGALCVCAMVPILLFLAAAFGG